MSIRTHSRRQIRPSCHIMSKILVLPDLGGFGILPYLFPVSEWGGILRTGCLVPVRGSPSSPSSSASLPGFFRLTFGPRFYHPRNYLRNEAEKKDVGQRSTSFCTEFDARLAGIVIRADRPYLGTNTRGLKSIQNHNIHNMHAPQIQGRFFLRKTKGACGRDHTDVKSLYIFKYVYI